MKTTNRLLALVGGAAIVVGACTGGGGTPAPSASGASADPGASSVPPSTGTFPEGDITLLLWTKEGAEQLQYVTDSTGRYTAEHPNVTFEIVNKDVETLREDFQTASLAGSAPDILWTVADHIGPFTSADLIMPLDSVIDASTYVPAAADIVKYQDQIWGAPISFGNQLMLYWNKELAGDTAPTDSDAWRAAAKTLTTGDNYGIVFNQTESFWLVPFLGGFGGSVFSDDGVTPTLDTPAMTSALQFLYDLKYTDKVTPAEADYNVADGIFKEGKAGFIINGDWTLATYASDTDGIGAANLGVGPLPKMSGGEVPKPYIAGSFYMIPKSVGDDADRLTVVSDFVRWATDKDEQIEMVKAYKRLPGNAEAFADDIVTGDELLAGAAAGAEVGVPQPTNLEMRCVFDSMTAGVRDLFTGNSDVAGIAATMQTSAETCITQLG